MWRLDVLPAQRHKQAGMYPELNHLTRLMQLPKSLAQDLKLGYQALGARVSAEDSLQRILSGPIWPGTG